MSFKDMAARLLKGTNLAAVWMSVTPRTIRGLHHLLMSLYCQNLAVKQAGSKRWLIRGRGLV
jgi:hypothetical protein